MDQDLISFTNKYVVDVTIASCGFNANFKNIFNVDKNISEIKKEISEQYPYPNENHMRITVNNNQCSDNKTLRQYLNFLDDKLIILLVHHTPTQKAENIAIISKYFDRKELINDSCIDCKIRKPNIAFASCENHFPIFCNKCYSKYKICTICNNEIYGGEIFILN